MKFKVNFTDGEMFYIQALLDSSESAVGSLAKKRVRLKAHSQIKFY